MTTTMDTEAVPAPAKTVPNVPTSPSKSYDGYSFRFHHIFKAITKHKHTPNAEAIEYTEDLPQRDCLFSSRQTRVAIFKDKQLLLTGEAVCWRPDNYIKATGRKHALMAATKNHLHLRQEILAAYKKYLQGQVDTPKKD